MGVGFLLSKLPNNVFLGSFPLSDRFLANSRAAYNFVEESQGQCVFKENFTPGQVVIFRNLTPGHDSFSDF